MSTPTEKAAAMRAAKLKRRVEAAATPEELPSQSAPSRPSRQSKVAALKNQVWMPEKTRKRAASSTAEPDHAKQPRTSDPKHNDPAGRKWKSTVPRPAAQLFDSDSDDFKIDGSDGAASDVGAESDDNLEESDDDSILGLVGDKLKATLDYERPQFTPRNDDSRSAASSFSSIPQSTTSPDSDNDGIDGIMDSAAEHKGNSQITNMKKTGPRYRPSKPKGTSMTNEKAALSKGSKRQKQREQEKPTWRMPDKVDDATSDGPPADDEPVSARSIRSREDDWLPSCRIVYSSSGKVNLTEQQSHIQDMLRASITSIHEHILFENAYLDLQQRRKIMADILLSCAKDRRGIHRREKTSYEGRKPEGRIGTIRGNVRKAAQAHVASHYGLTKGADDRVADLLKNNAYIYPVNVKGDPIRTKPFQAPAILDTIEDAFFSDELAAGVKWHDHLTSTIDDHPDELELPVAMVALASAAYSSEKFDRDFNSDMYSGIYRTLVGMLNGIFKASERKFHVLVHSLYKSVYGSKRKTEEPCAADSLMFLDIDAFDKFKLPENHVLLDANSVLIGEK
ncbi:hypothetical protein EDD22DRAFT_852275 [Suillus occidentalis]|nr:hypothetical protein EDD22DRAFT_852275 [Suillus occidentalis]